MKQVSLILILVLLLTRCDTHIEVELANDSTINEIFSPNEIEDLNKLLHFFESQICYTENVQITNTLQCYASFFEQNKEKSQDGTPSFNVSFSEQKYCYELLDSSTFNQIWTFYRTQTKNDTDTLKYLDFRQDGKYIRFLKEFGKANPVINQYYNNFLVCTGICPPMKGSILFNYPSFDMSDVKMRLIVAIHYLTINDQKSRNEKY